MDIDYIYASDKTGEAVRAIVTGTRTAAATTLEVDSLDNWPAKFVATAGTLNESTGIINPDTVTIFKGHTSGGDIIIDEFAPGYTDDGNSVGQVVVLKPNTFWADTVADMMKVSLNSDGTLKDDIVTSAKIADGTIDTLNVKDGAISYVKLLSTIFSGQVTTDTNPGSAGGTRNYINLGGIKIAYGVTSSWSTSTTPSDRTVGLPTSFFTSVHFATASPYIPAATAQLVGNVNNISTSQLNIYLWNTIGTGSGRASWLVIGS